jgi:hypothetical protein
MHAMNISPAVSKVVLVPDPRPVASHSPARRYRIARLEVPGRRGAGDERFDHLRRVYD